MRKDILIGVVFIVLILGFMFSFNINGNVVTGSVVLKESVENEYFKIDDSAVVSPNTYSELNEEENLNGTQNNSGSR